MRRPGSAARRDAFSFRHRREERQWMLPPGPTRTRARRRELGIFMKAMKRCGLVRSAAAAVMAAGMALASSSAEAAVPPTITHQGRLFDAKGAPVSQELDVVFTLYADADGVTEIWT